MTNIRTLFTHIHDDYVGWLHALQYPFFEDGSDGKTFRLTFMQYAHSFPRSLHSQSLSFVENSDMTEKRTLFQKSGSIG